MSEIILDKLPKYAQEEIVALRRNVVDLQQALLDQRQDVPSRVEWGKAWRGGPCGFLPDDETVTFLVNMKPERRIRVRLNDNGLYATSDGSLQILCESSNCFTVQERPR